MTRMPSLTAFTQYIPVLSNTQYQPGQTNQEKEIKNIRYETRKNKLPLFAVNMILYIENSIKIIY